MANLAYVKLKDRMKSDVGSCCNELKMWQLNAVSPYEHRLRINYLRFELILVPDWSSHSNYYLHLFKVKNCTLMSRPF